MKESCFRGNHLKMTQMGLRRMVGENLLHATRAHTLIKLKDVIVEALTRRNRTGRNISMDHPRIPLMGLHTSIPLTHHNLIDPLTSIATQILTPMITHTLVLITLITRIAT